MLAANNECNNSYSEYVIIILVSTSLICASVLLYLSICIDITITQKIILIGLAVAIYIFSIVLLIVAELVDLDIAFIRLLIVNPLLLLYFCISIVSSSYPIIFDIYSLLIVLLLLMSRIVSELRKYYYMD